MSINEEKKRAVEEIRGRFNQAKSAILTDYRGLDVADMTELRKKLREAGVEYRVLKNTLTKIAISDLGLEALDDHLKGPTAIAFGYEDPVVPAKVLAEFNKDHKDHLPVIKAGTVEGKFIDVEGVKALADLPSREVLLAQVLAGMQAPITGFVRAANGIISGLVYALNAVKEQKEQQAS